MVIRPKSIEIVPFPRGWGSWVATVMSAMVLTNVVLPDPGAPVTTTLTGADDCWPRSAKDANLFYRKKFPFTEAILADKGTFYRISLPITASFL